eukprot:7308263-Prymnesium_polylepis.1
MPANELHRLCGQGSKASKDEIEATIEASKDEIKAALADHPKWATEKDDVRGPTPYPEKQGCGWRRAHRCTVRVARLTAVKRAPLLAPRAGWRPSASSRPYA